MAFNFSGATFLSFAVTSELDDRDQRLFEANEGLTSNVVDDLLKQASQRILTQIRNTDWWKSYAFDQDTTLNRDLRLLPNVNPSYIKSREQEFKDLNIYFTLSEYVYPRIADFGNPDSAEVVKIKFFRDQYDNLFKELIQSGDWYDFDGDATIELTEKDPNKQNRVRVR